MFVIESLGQRGNSKYFVVMLVLYVISLPGTFISIVPYHKFVGST